MIVVGILEPLLEVFAPFRMEGSHSLAECWDVNRTKVSRML